VISRVCPCNAWGSTSITASAKTDVLLSTGPPRRGGRGAGRRGYDLPLGRAF
jgi:hypothetical protein